ncbi:hypothetical protein [Jannaschia sp. M317]|uniref:hypothetical protein n=1 Tax=Jannaschia sp. M317 TaxID=2867011 RepID=UPI0021A4A3D1|nr:hypothetical protein [Jannaschia sp. M317]UWQ18892.1 hypothetical protein K3551_06315 [Jannaschia sp. M317]
MRKTAAFLLFLTLVSCGVDGDPLRPSQVEEQDAAQPASVTLSGSVGVGIARQSP